jgi:hypothetical protein
MAVGLVRLFAMVPVVALGLGAAPGALLADPAEVTWGEAVAVASGGGYRGPWRMNESEYRFVDDPTVAMDEDGVVAVAWADQARQDVFLQIFEPDGTERFAEPVNVSRSPGIFSWLPRMLITGGEGREVAVLWQDIVFSGGSHGGEIFFARSTDGGATFDEPRNLSNTVAGAGKGRFTRDHWHNGSLDLAIGPDGTLYAAWTEYEGALWLARSTDGGASFSAPLHLAGDDARPTRAPSLAVDGEGNVHLAWIGGEAPAADIHLTHSLDGGQTFAEPRVAIASGGHTDAPKIAVDGEGRLHLTYGKSPGGLFDRYHVRYTRSHDGGQTFEAPSDISGPHAEQFASAAFPSLGVDDAGRVHIVWELFPRDFRPHGLGMASSSDGGETFAAPSIVPGSDDPALGRGGGRQGLLMSKLAVNRAGSLALVHSTFAENEASHIWLVRGQASGTSSASR